MRHDLFLDWFLNVRDYLTDYVEILWGYWTVLLLMKFGRDKVFDDRADVEWRCFSMISFRW